MCDNKTTSYLWAGFLQEIIGMPKNKSIIEPLIPDQENKHSLPRETPDQNLEFPLLPLHSIWRYVHPRFAEVLSLLSKSKMAAINRNTKQSTSGTCFLKRHVPLKRHVFKTIPKS